MTQLTAHDSLYLHRKQKAVTYYIAQGLDTKEIAEVTGLSVRNVKYYAEQAMHKLGADNRAHLVTLAFFHGILRFLCVTFMLLGMGTTLARTDGELRGRSPRTSRTVRVTRNARRKQDIDDLLELVNV